MMRLDSITRPSIISQAISYIKTNNVVSEGDLRIWFQSQHYEHDFHYFTTRLMSRDNICRRFNPIKNENIFYYACHDKNNVYCIELH